MRQPLSRFLCTSAAVLALGACQSTQNRDEGGAELASFQGDYNYNAQKYPQCHNQSVQQAGGGLGWRIRYNRYFAKCASGTFQSSCNQNAQVNPPCHENAGYMAGSSSGWRNRYSQYYQQCTQEQVPPDFTNNYQQNYQ